MSFDPKLQDLPAEFAVFPLTGALLLPRGKLPLNIFEPRYLAMVEDSLGAGRMFGMIQPDPTAPTGDTGPGLYRVGCLGRLSAFSETEDGRFLITLTGLARFLVGAEVAMVRGYRRVRGDFSGFEQDLEMKTHPIGVDRELLLKALKNYFARRNFEANWEAIRNMPDETLVTTLSMVCPFEPAEKQALLEASTDEGRAGTLLALLQMGAADLGLPPGHIAS
ncbi:MAG: LON peptidase substrate-binding domain-containing protein [Acetobacteraceae bacterium]|nr:LON peptidase substrate-binding domain-containing protein [Acetobacteraceae bacterium]